MFGLGLVKLVMISMCEGAGVKPNGVTREEKNTIKNNRNGS